ncbi:MAG: hypothetical protein ABIQ56_02795 [Chitinophagaceae bacterium]
MKLKTLLWSTSMTLLFTACQKEKGELLQNEELSPTSASAKLGNDDKDKSDSRHVYTLSNATNGNMVLDYLRSSNGTLTFSASYATGGNGSGGGLGNQGAIILANVKDHHDDDERILLGVNAGSNSISSFRIHNNGLHLRSTVSSGGIRPVSITQHDDLVFVLNGGGTNNISGFKLKDNGMLKPIPNSTRPLSAASTGPAQVSFVHGGKVLVITEKATNKIVSYTVNEHGIPGTMHTITSSSPTPFGFAVGQHGKIFVSEAVGGAPGASVLSSYQVHNNGAVTLINGSVGAGQSAACWVVLSHFGRYAFTTNTASDNISKYSVSNSGDISVSQAIAVTTQAGPIDAAITRDSRYFYVLNGGGNSIQAFAVGNTGNLSLIQTVPGLPMGATGLAVN